MTSTGDTLAARFDPRRNAIGFMRLAFAVAVIVSHTWPLSGHGPDPGRADNNLGILAVEGFFALSGYLITRSASRSPSVGRFLWHRCLRIFPGFWASLIVVAVTAAVVTGANSWGFVWKNLTLHMWQTGIGNSLAANPFPYMWNGPLYTLEFEFLCYLLVAGLTAAKMLRPRVLLGITGWCWFGLQAVTYLTGIDDRQARFTLAFFVGATLFAFADKVPAGRVSLTVTLGVAAGSYWAGGFTLVGIPAFAAAVVIVSTWLPWRRVGVRRDLSYGMYLYAWPVQQVLIWKGAAHFGLGAFFAATLASVTALACASWFLVERPSLDLKKLHAAVTSTQARPIPEPATEPVRTKGRGSSGEKVNKADREPASERASITVAPGIANVPDATLELPNTTTACAELPPTDEPAARRMDVLPTCTAPE